MQSEELTQTISDIIISIIIGVFCSLLNGLLKYRAQAPVIDSILKDIGLSGESIQGLTKTLTDVKPEVKITKVEELVAETKEPVKVANVSKKN